MQILPSAAVPFLNVVRPRKQKNAVHLLVLKIAIAAHGPLGVTATLLSLVICNVVLVLSNVSVPAHPLNMEVNLALKTIKSKHVFFLVVLPIVK
jgi:hypothetical protein